MHTIYCLLSILFYPNGYKVIYFVNHLMAQEEAKRLANIAMSNIREEDYIHRGFLKPI